MAIVILTPENGNVEIPTQLWDGVCGRCGHDYVGECLGNCTCLACNAQRQQEREDSEEIAVRCRCGHWQIVGSMASYEWAEDEEYPFHDEIPQATWRAMTPEERYRGFIQECRSHQCSRCEEERINRQTDDLENSFLMPSGGLG